MDFLVILLVIVIILGALLGGRSFGGIVRKGCGFLTLLVLITAAAGALYYWRSELKMNSNIQEAVSSSHTPVYFIVKEDCQTYTKPNIESDISGHLEAGKDLLIENVNEFNYFYKFSDENGKISYVRKECLKKLE